MIPARALPSAPRTVPLTVSASPGSSGGAIRLRDEILAGKPS